MSKKKKKNKLSPQQARGAAIRQFCVVVFALFAALAVCGGTLSFRFYGDEWETGGTLGPLLTMSPLHTDAPVVPVDSTSEREPVTIAPETETSAPPVTEPPITEPPATEPPVTQPPATEPPTTEPPVTQPPVNDDPEALETHPRPPVTEPITEPDPVPVVRVEEREAVDDTYFTDALFIGDSRTVGLQLYSGLKSNYYAQQGLNVSSVTKNAFVSSGDQKLTLSQALEANPGFNKVYISFGINEIGWNTTQSFIDAYTALVDLVAEKLPHAYIYVQEILPMTKTTAENDRYRPMGGNGKVAEYNERLYSLCEEKGLYYIALTEIFADEHGDLTITDTFDGIHLGVASSKAWISYLKTHTLP
ncbi:MAG: hypothetical protein IJD06_08835 [Clostridia bacterium]|nr:hypothetical protein [Clostridia bacterium]